MQTQTRGLQGSALCYLLVRNAYLRAPFFLSLTRRREYRHLALAGVGDKKTKELRGTHERTLYPIAIALLSYLLSAYSVTRQLACYHRGRDDVNATPAIARFLPFCCAYV